MEDRHNDPRMDKICCERNEVPELAQTFLVEWNPRFTCRLGDASYSRILTEPEFA